MEQQAAQSRADQVRTFRVELEILDSDDVLTLPEQAKAHVRGYHDALLHAASERFDIDTSQTQKRLSWSMRIASFIGALALSAAVFFFYRFWGLLGTPAQTLILVAAPLLTTLAVEWIARRERQGLYFTSLAALVAFACFVLDLSMLGRIFNITPSENAFLAWAAFGLILAYTYGLKLILVAGLTSLMGYLAATVGTWSGMYRLSFGERPENFVMAGLLLFAGGLVLPSRRPAFAAIYRVYGLLVVFIAMLILSNWGNASYLPLSTTAIENTYQILGLVGSALAVWLGIRRLWPGQANLGITFFVLFLYTKLFDWRWDWMPKYLFFLLLGLIAVGLLLVLKRLRAATREPAT
ncbi:MAG: DUF2157 domain-containing protein [Acidihalobacter sp.]|uniref:DUF2157 domain-containing protein n=1 Tax=Acidihalobacter sp. TaxID=1872108 RepID=UPI00307F0BBC